MKNDTLIIGTGYLSDNLTKKISKAKIFSAEKFIDEIARTYFWQNHQNSAGQSDKVLHATQAYCQSSHSLK